MVAENTPVCSDPAAGPHFRDADEPCLLLHMPYLIGFKKTVPIVDREQYINDCCVGGDLVLDQLLPRLRARYGKSIQSNQEDWGWFAWFESAGTKLAVDVFTDDEVRCEFQIHLTSRKPRFILGAKTQDTPELEELRQLVIDTLTAWQVDDLSVARANEKDM